jgi:outer membrane protein assembly factor BamB
VYGIDVATGEERSIAARSGGPLSAPAVARVGQIQAVLYLEGSQEPEASASASGTASASTSPSASPSASPDGEAVGPGEVDGSSSFLVAVSLRDGTELWRVPLQAVARSGVTVDDTTAYVGDQQGHVVAVALADGSVTWTAEVPGRVDVPVAVSGGTVYVVARDADAPAVAIAALDAATGERSWQVFPRATSTFGSAPAAGVGFVLVGSADRLVRSIAAEDGTERWTSLVLSFFSPATAPAFAGDAVYAADLSGGLYRIDAADGHREWSHQLNEIVLRSAPVVSGPTVLLGLNDGRLVAFDSESGHLVWESEATPGLVGAIALGSDVVIAVKGGRDGGLIAFEHDPEGELLDLAPPTELETGTTLSRYGLAAAIVLIVALIPGIALRRRLGPPNLSGDQADPGEDLGDEDAEGGQP